MAKEKYNAGKLPKLWDYLAKLHRERPELFDSGYTLREEIARVWPAIKDPKHCPNCGESMSEYIHKLDFFNALLLKQMGDIVKGRVASGVPFRIANAVHVVGENLHDCVRHRTTQCRTLGLIAKFKTADGTHDREKGWIITARGFAALRGERVPAEVDVFRNRITERTDVTTTLDAALRDTTPDNRALVGARNPMEWVNFGKAHEGTMF